MPFGGENAESYFDDGLTAVKKGDLPRAMQCFERALKLDPGYAAAYHQLGNCHIRLGQYDRGIACLNEAVKRKTGQIHPRLDLGFALITVGAFTHAQAQFREVMLHDATNWRVHLGLGLAEFYQGQYDAALSEALAAQANGGSNVSVLFLLGRAAQLTGNAIFGQEVLSKADALLEKSLELSPNQAESLFLRGEIAFALGQFASAIERYHGVEPLVRQGQTLSAFGVTFTLLDVLARQGVCFQRLKRGEQAREMGRRILKYDPEHKLGKALTESQG